MEYKLFEDISAVEGKVVLKFDLGENTEHVIKNIILRHKQPTTPGGCTDQRWIQKSASVRIHAVN